MAHRDELSSTRARQGLKGRPVLYVLLGGLALGALYIIGLMAFSQSDKPAPSVGVVQDANKGGSKGPTVDPQVGRQTTEKPKSAQ